MKNIVISIIMLSSLAGCHIYRNYERPDNLSVNDSLFRHPVAEEDTMTIASVSWRELFTDPKLQELIECGLENNTDLRIAFLKVNEAEASLMSSKLSFLPSLGLSADASISSLGGESATETYSVGASASWEIDIFGKLRNAKKGTEALLYQYEANARAVQTLLIATIADSYYTLLAIDEQLKTSQETSKNWSSYVKTLVALKDNGTVKESDIAQAKANSIKHLHFPRFPLQGKWIFLPKKMFFPAEETLFSCLGKFIFHTREKRFPSEGTFGILREQGRASSYLNTIRNRVRPSS